MKFLKVSITEFCIITLYKVSLPGYTWKCGLKCTGRNLQIFKDRELIFLLENKIRGGFSSVMGDHFVKSN